MVWNWFFWPRGYEHLVEFLFLYYLRNFDKLAFRLGYPLGSRDLWGCNYCVWLYHWGMEQKTGLWQRERRALRSTIPQKVQCSFPPPQMAVWQLAMVGASPGGERRCWRMCRYLFPQVFPPQQSCTRTTDLAVVMQSCLPLQFPRDLPWHFAQLWAPGAVVGRRALPKKPWVYCAVPWSAMQRSPSDPLPRWETGIIHPPLTTLISQVGTALHLQKHHCFQGWSESPCTMWSVQIGRRLCFVLQRFSNFAQGLRPKVKAQQNPAVIATVFMDFRFSSFTEIWGIFNFFFKYPKRLHGISFQNTSWKKLENLPQLFLMQNPFKPKSQRRSGTWSLMVYLE